jgi:hypothetical protein
MFFLKTVILDDEPDENHGFPQFYLVNINELT